MKFRLNSMKMRLSQSLLQIKVGWKDALSASAAAGLAWGISHYILGHPRPIFASMGAVIALAPGLANHGRQAVHLFIGVSIGVLIGEFGLDYLIDTPTEIRIFIVCFTAMILALAYAVAALPAIQSGMSAVMVFAMGRDVAGVTKIEDIAVGVGLGLIFSQVLFTPDPLKALRSSAELLLRQLAGIYDTAANALEKQDTALAKAALQNCNRVHTSLVALAASVTSAQESTLWSLRGLIFSREVGALAQYYNRAAIRLYASTLLLCEALQNSLKKPGAEPPPAWFQQSLRISAENCRFLAGMVKSGEFIRQHRSERGDVPLAWADCANGLQLVENTLARFYKSKSRRARLSVSRRNHKPEIPSAKAKEANAGAAAADENQ